MRPPLRLVVSAALLVALELATAAAWAGDKEQARDRFERGVAAFENERYTEALEQFQTADRLQHAPEVTYNIARALESLGRAQRAVEAYEAYVAEAGVAGEYATAATVAVAEIKTRATHLRISTAPPGAKVTVDGETLQDRSPVTVLLFRGWHHVSVALGSWRASRDYEAAGHGDSAAIELTRPAPEKPKPADRRPKRQKQPPPPPRGPRLDGLMGGAALSLSAYRFVGGAEESRKNEETSANSAASGLVFGLNIDVGYALSSRTALILRGFGALGSAEGELASLAAGGPITSFRIARRWWFGAGVILGGSRAQSDATTRKDGTMQNPLGSIRDSEITYRTDFALGPMLELSFALAENEAGQWLISLLPGTLLTAGNEQSTLFVPLVLGHRWL